MLISSTHSILILNVESYQRKAGLENASTHFTALTADRYTILVRY